MQDLAPVVVFVYNRPAETQQVLDSLAANPEARETSLFIYCDGPKRHVTEQTLARIEATRSIARKETRFKRVSVTEQKINKGLSESVIEGVTSLCAWYGKVIVLEDDIVTSPFFLLYMNKALTVYEHDERVGSISGYWYPVKKHFDAPFFLRDASCWGWATWHRAWREFEKDGSKLLSELRRRDLTRQFDIDGTMAYTKMLEDQVAGKNDSWAVRWDATNFLAGKMALFPNISLVKNIGFDGKGTHSGNVDYYDVHISNESLSVPSSEVIESSDARNALKAYYRAMRRKYVFNRIKQKLGLEKFHNK